MTIDLTSKEQAVIYNALCDRLNKLKAIMVRKPENCSATLEATFMDIQSQIDTIDNLFETGKL